MVPLAVAAGTGRGADLAGNVNAVAVVSTTTWDAMRAAKLAEAELDAAGQTPPTLNSAQFLADAQALLLNAPPYVAGGANPPGTLYTVEASTAEPRRRAGARPTCVASTPPTPCPMWPMPAWRC